MDKNLIFQPVLVQVLLTLAVYIMLGSAKRRALRRGEVDLARRALHSDAWPDSVLRISNNIANQFEAPVLFFVLALTTWALDQVDLGSLVLGWTFVASRIAHAVVHIGPNRLVLRRRLFTFGCVLLLWMAARLVLHIV